MSRLQLTFVLLFGLFVGTAASRAQPALSPGDYLEIEQLVYKYGWALDSGENDGFAYADLYAPDPGRRQRRDRPAAAYQR